MIKDGGLSFETQLEIEFLPPHNDSKKMLGKITEEGQQERNYSFSVYISA